MSRFITFAHSKMYGGAVSYQSLTTSHSSQWVLKNVEYSQASIKN